MSSSADALRLLNLGELLDRTFFLYRKNFVLLVGIAALPQLLFLAAQLLEAILAPPQPQTGLFPNINFLALGIQMILLLFVTAVTESAVVVAVSRLYLGGRISVREAYAAIIGRVFHVALMMIAVGFVAGMGFILCIVPGVFLTIIWCLTIPVAIVERKGLGAAASRSFELTKGWWGQIFVIHVLYFVLIYIFLLLFQVPITIYALVSSNGNLTALPIWLVVASAIGTFVSSSLATPLFVVALSLVYYNQRVRKEAFDLQHMMSVLDEAAPASTP